MSRERPTLQVVLYPVFLVSCVTAVALGLLMIWGMQLSVFLFRFVGTCALLAVATAFTMSATRLVSGRVPEDDRG